MKKREILYYGFSICSCIPVFQWLIEMIKGEFLPEKTGPFCLALLCTVLFFVLGKRVSKKNSEKH